MANEPEEDTPLTPEQKAAETAEAMRETMSPADISRFCSPESIIAQTAIMKAMVQKNPSMKAMITPPELLCAALQAPLPKAPKTR